MFDVDLLMPDAGKPSLQDGLSNASIPSPGPSRPAPSRQPSRTHAAAAASAAAAFPAWSLLGPGERRARLSAAADEIEAREGRLHRGHG